jgi:hypothetical protein
MKALLIVHNVAIDPDVNELLKDAGVDCYTKFTHTLGRGRLSEPHLDSDVWPGINCATFVVTDRSRANQIMQSVRRTRDKLGSEGLKAFLWEIEDIT